MVEPTASGMVEERLWSDRLALGVTLIDGQHRSLVARLEALLKAIQSGRSGSEVRQCFDFVERYTQEHFQTEEHYMALHAFPGLAPHQQLHRDFRATVTKARRFIDAHQGSEKGVQLVHSLLANWYVQHIRGADQEYVTFFRGKGVTELSS